jgi:signal transduction histidine kinase
LTSLHYPESETGPVISLAVDRNDDPWISTAIGGTYHFSHGVWSRQNEALGKKPGIIGAMAGDDAGNVWFGFSNNLVRWDGSAYQRFSFPNGTRGVSESTMSVRGDHVWMGGSGGIELFTHGHFYLLHWKDPNLPGRVSGVVETETGELWANGSTGITHVPAAELARWLGNPTSVISAEHFAALDGLPGYSAERIPEPSVAESREGRLWFATAKGIAWLDPAKLQENRNRIPPPVMTSAILANGKTYAASKDLILPAHTENLEIDYTALSLAIPERVLFRYKLDGVDDQWQDAGTRRQAFYTSLPPRLYRFHVIACNNDGVWNESGTTLGFAIAPAYYQTWWFSLLCGLVAALLLWWLIRLRIRSITHELQSRLAERMAERERIARELHDTLLQSFQGLMMKLYTLTYVLDRPTEARERLEVLLAQGQQAIEEGRDAVRGMRSSTVVQNDLARALAMVGERLAAEQNAQNPVGFRVLVEGEPRDMHPILRDEVYRIASEATRNAFRHSGATRIDVELCYNDRQLRVRIEDNGKGIDAKVLDGGGREGHYGLTGMRERAKLAGGKLTLRSRHDSGTEIEFTIPASLAYAKSSQ